MTQWLELLAIFRRVLEEALTLPGTDIEDNVQIVSAQLAHLDLIVTRDTSGFQQSPIQAINPASISQWLTAHE